MSDDRIIELSESKYPNLLNVVVWEGKIPGICVDSRAINKFTLPERATILPMHELLQQFHGSNSVTSMHLSSAFLKVALKPECRMYTTFLFGIQVYRFTQTLYGFRNSFLAFVRTLQIRWVQGLTDMPCIRRSHPCPFTNFWASPHPSEHCIT